MKYSTFYVFNIVFQSIFTLLWQVGAALLVGWIFVNFVNAPPWIYVPLIIIAVISGFVSMVRFIIAAMNALEKLEEQKRIKIKKLKQNNPEGNKK